MKLLEMKHIKKEFDGLGVLKDISLAVEEGEILSIIGPSAPANRRCCAVRPCWSRLMAERSAIWESGSLTLTARGSESIRRVIRRGKYILILDWYSRILICFLIFLL